MENKQTTTYNEEWLIGATIADMQQAMAASELTSRDLVMMYLERIAMIDKDGPKLNSVLEVNPDAVFIAEALDLERRTKGARGPLHGIPVLVKDNIDTADKMHTSAGSLALANNYAAEDSFVAKRLRQAGAVILGKANMTEWANYMTLNMPNGYSSRGGQVLNPYGPGKFDVGGSSSGSGSSVAASLAAVTIGTETSGSILSPADRNSVVGIKPTVGLISRSGIIPIAHSQDTAGPLARTVADAATLLGALTGVDEKDAATWASEGRALTDYTVCLDANGLQGARIGVARGHYFSELNEEQKALMEAAIEVLKQSGAEVIDVEIANAAAVDENYEVLTYEFRSALNAYLTGLGPNVPVHSLADVIEFNNNHAEAALKYDQILLLRAQETSGTLTEPEYIQLRAQDLAGSRTNGIDATVREHQLDALFFPSYFGCAIAAKAGYPSVCVPAGYTPSENQPIGVTFSGLAYSEPTLIKLAYAYEQATKHRVAPKF